MVRPCWVAKNGTSEATYSFAPPQMALQAASMSFMPQSGCQPTNTLSTSVGSGLAGVHASRCRPRAARVPRPATAQHQRAPDAAALHEVRGDARRA